MQIMQILTINVNKKKSSSRSYIFHYSEEWKYKFYIFTSENITFSKYAFYFINNSLYFITFYKICMTNYNKPWATSGDSDQPAHSHSRIRSSLITCDFHSVRAIQRGLNENHCFTGWMYRLNWVSAGHRDLIVGFVVRWLIWNHWYCIMYLSWYLMFSLQSNLNSSNTDGSFTIVFRTRFWVPTKIFR